MARIFIDGWETGDTGNWKGEGGQPGYVTVIAAPAGMTGSYVMRCRSFSSFMGWVEKDVANLDPIYMSFRMVMKAYGSFDPYILRLRNGATTLLLLEVNVATNRIKAWRDASTLIATSTAIFPVDTVKHIQIRYVPHTSTGILQIKIDDILDIDFAGQSCASTNPIDNILIGMMRGFSSDVYFDDLVIDDAAWIGNSQISGLVPDGAGASTQFTPSAGANYTCVDETPPSAADYVYTNTVAQDDLYTLDDLPADVIAVKSVQVSAVAWKDGGATPQNAELLVRSGGTIYPSGDKALPSSAGVNILHLWETDPDTAAAWAIAAVDALEAGVRSKT